MGKRALAAVITCALAQLGATAAQASPTVPLSHQGRWITDATGRVVILHGVNMVYKVPPYYPAASGFGDDDAAFLERNGFNTVRLGLIYAGVEPNPGAYDDGYLDQIAATEATLAQHGIFSQLDFHQDMYNERFQGEGWPDWAVQDDGLPATPQSGFPANYVLMPALNHAFDHFWANDPGPGGIGLQDRYAAAFRHVAERFRDRQHTVGYDLMNEPWPGTPYASCFSPAGCPLFDTGTLAPFYQRVTTQIRQVEGQKLVWEEPNSIFNFGADSSLVDTDPGGFSFHVYCMPGSIGVPEFNTLGCDQLDQIVFENADKQSRETGQALMVTEFGATDDLATIGRDVRYAEQRMVSWQYWHYCECLDPTTAGSGVQAIVVDPSQPPTGSNVKQAKLDLLSEPYPQVVAGTPERFSFDEGSNRFQLAYSTTAPNGANLTGIAQPQVSGKGGGKHKRKHHRHKRKRRRGGGGQSQPTVTAGSPQTEIFLGAPRYPNVYDVAIAGGGIASAPGAPVLRVAACPGVKEVTLSVRPPGQPITDGPDCLVAGAQLSKLRLSIKPRRAIAGRRTCFRITVLVEETRSPVSGTAVRLKGTRKATRRQTNAVGGARICKRFSRPGKYKLRATKLGFANGSARIRVLPRNQAGGTR
jgi:endoglycosylceramidase